MRKAQTEIMGLIVIVILLTLGMFLIITFQASKPKPEIKKSFEDDQLASNFLLSFLKTGACGKNTMENMIQDCAVERKITCGGMDSCKYINETAKIILNKTMDEWSKKYSFDIEGTSEEIKFENSCNRTLEGDSAFQPISLYPYPGTVVLNIYLCE